MVKTVRIGQTIMARSKLKIEKDPFDCRYAHADDIRTKLHHCYVLYDGKAAYIDTNYDEDDYKLVKLTIVDRGANYPVIRTDIRDEKIEQYDLPLGWFNRPVEVGYTLQAGFAERLPFRMWKQGITLSNIYIYHPALEGLGTTNCGVTDHDIGEVMNPTYPKLNEAVDLLRFASGNSTALSRSVALRAPLNPTMDNHDELDVFVERVLIGKLHLLSMTVETTKPGFFSMISHELEKVGLQ
jgi:hypothetical protein